MSKNTPTLKTIAENLGLSIGTVQRALYNKGGYSKETQERILAEAARCGYVANPAASALRRAPLQFAAVLPEPIGQNRYFFQYIWKGIEEAIRDFSMYNIRLQKIYADTNSDSAEQKLTELLADPNFKADAIITSSSTANTFSQTVEAFTRRNIPVFLVNALEDRQDCSIRSNIKRELGKLAADVASAFLKDSTGKLLLLGGSRINMKQITHSNEFYRNIMDTCPNITVVASDLYDDLEKIPGLIAEYANAFPDLRAIYAVSSRETLYMCQAIRDLGISGKLLTIGTDVFPELIPFFEDQSLTVSIYQFPIQQGYTAVKTLISHITHIDLNSSFTDLPAVAVYRSNAKAFI